MNNQILLQNLLTVPHGEIPVPAVPVCEVRLWTPEDHGPFLIRLDDLHLRPFESRMRTPPSELYLRDLMSLDLGDAEAVTGFVSNFGWLVTERNEYEDPDAPDDRAPHWLVDFPELSRASGLHFSPDADMGYELLWGYRRLQQATTEGHQERERLGIVGRRIELGLLEEVRIHARLLRNATRAWQALQGQMPAEWKALPGQLTVEQALEQWESSDGVSDDLLPPGGDQNDPQDLADYLCTVLDIGLRQVHPRVAVAHNEGEHGTDWNVTNIGLFEALCLQLRNDIDEGSQFRRCRACNSLFARQKGHEGRGRRTQGVLNYCSVDCANRQGVRDYRARERQKRSQGGQGGTP